MWIDILRCEDAWRTPLWSLVRASLYPPSLSYAALMRLRRWAYRKGVLPSMPAGKPVISVGNITTGGTGKTPMVAWIALELQSAGRRAGIVLRGYKATGGRSDEAELLKQLTGAIVIVHADRVAGAAQAVAAGADVIVLDDGFQHRRLRRDVDIVLIDAADPFGLGYCLPRGLLREPASALADADAVVITRSDAVNRKELDVLRNKLSRLAPRAVIVRAAHKPVAAVDGAGQRLAPSALAGRKVFAFCGIGSPRSFLHTLSELGARIVGQCILEDHCEYSPQLLEELSAMAGQAEAQLAVTTQKDYVKIGPTQFALPLWQLTIEMDVTEGREELAKVLANAK
jgi:tetraacyldisaccharide 4'-kinase